MSKISIDEASKIPDETWITIITGMRCGKTALWEAWKAERVFGKQLSAVDFLISAQEAYGFKKHNHPEVSMTKKELKKEIDGALESIQDLR